MRNDRHTFEEEYNLNFSNINQNNTLTSSLIISEYTGKDTLFINLYDDNDQSVYNYVINDPNFDTHKCEDNVKLVKKSTFFRCC